MPTDINDEYSNIDKQLSSEIEKEIFTESDEVINLIERETDIFNDKIDEDKEAIEFAKEGNLKKESIDYLYTKRYNQNTKLRSKLARWVKGLVSTYLVLVFFLLCLNDYLIHISDAVLITLLGTTTVNVLGLMYITMKDLFNGKSEDKK